VAQGVEKALRAADPVSLQISAEGYSPRVAHAETPILSNAERETVELLAHIDFEYVASDSVNLTFRRTRDNGLRLSLSPRRLLPRVHVPMLLGQVGERVVGHPYLTGLMIPCRGYVELVCTRLQAATAKRLFRLESKDSDCPHKPASNEPASLAQLAGRGWRTVPQASPPIRMDGRPCLEISNASPLAELLFGRNWSGS
jgi:hypothetical protein